jgi:hypothetical protein
MEKKMRLLPIIFCALLICSCASGKPQYIPPVVVVEEVQTALPEPVENEVVETVEKTEPVKTYAEDSFLAILIAEGTPSENFIPRSKEQVAIYNKGEHFSFYYFKKNQLVQKKDYPLAEIEQMKAENNYPDKALQEMGIIE